MNNLTFSSPDLSSFCQLNNLGLVATGQHLCAKQAVIECRFTKAPEPCPKCGAAGFSRGTVDRHLAHAPYGQRPSRLLLRIRRQLRERLYRLLPDQQSSAAVVALVLGDGSAIAREQWQILRDSGTVHLFVISGQHISLLAGLAYGLVAWLHRWSLWPARLPWLPVACCLAADSALFYGALAGFNVPVQRALICRYQLLSGG